MFTGLSWPIATCARHDLAQRRHRRGFDRDVRAAGHDLSKDRLRRARHAEDDFVNTVSANHRLQVVSGSEHLPAADCPALQGLVVVHEPDDFEIRIPQLVQQVEARFSRAGQQQTPADRRRGRGLPVRWRDRKERAGRDARQPERRTPGTDE